MITARRRAVEHAFERSSADQCAVKLQTLGLLAGLFHHDGNAAVFGRGKPLVGKAHPELNCFTLSVLAAIGGKRDIAPALG